MRAWLPYRYLDWSLILLAAIAVYWILGPLFRTFVRVLLES